MSGYMRLTLGKTKYLIPQGEVIGLEPAIDVDLSGLDDGSIGAISYENLKLPVYCFTQNLELTRTLPESRRICVCLRHGDIQFGLLCDEVDNAQDLNFATFMVPECMKTENCPVEKLAVYGNKVINIVNTESIARVLPPFNQSVNKPSGFSDTSHKI